MLLPSLVLQNCFSYNHPRTFHLCGSYNNEEHSFKTVLLLDSLLHVLCILTSFWVLRASKSWWNYFFQPFLTFFVEKLLTKLKAVAVASCEKWEWLTYSSLFLIDVKIPIFDLKWLPNLSRCCYQIFDFGDI